MEWLLIVFAILLAVLLLILLTKVKIFLQYKRKLDNDYLQIKCRAWFGLLRYSVDVPIIKVDAEAGEVQYKTEKKAMQTEKKEENNDITIRELMKNLEDVKELVVHIVGLHVIVRKLLGKIRIRKLEWHSAIGTGDAVFTATVVGGAWALKGTILGLLSTYFSFKTMPHYSIMPDYQKTFASTSFFCIADFRIGHAIVAGIKLIRYWKGGKAKFKSKQLAKLSKDSKEQMM